MNLPYKPKIFCGNGTAIPPGYDALGTRYECLRKGFGAGKSSIQYSVSYMPVFLLILAAVSVAIITYFFLSKTQKHSKQGFVRKNKSSSYKDDTNKKNYNVRPT
jgi:hypothetical protein